MSCELMNQAPIPASELQERIHQIVEDAGAFLQSRQTPGQPFGHFSHCSSAYVNDEVSATSVALELWKMLSLPVTDNELLDMLDYLNGLQLENGLILDPSWKERALENDPALISEGDSFFTRCLVAALKAWDLQLEKPVAYLLDEDPEKIVKQIAFHRGAHGRFALGDIAVLIDHNARLGLPEAQKMQELFIKAARERQDPISGLWVEPLEQRAAIHERDVEWTHHINRTFHIIKFIYNDQNVAIPYADHMIDFCLRAKDDEGFYSWETGFACNELDLAHVMYSASRWTDHRKDEVAVWAQTRLPMILSNQKAEGGFSFRHDSTMTVHCRLKISPGVSEADLWGTLMYLGAVKMMVHLGYPSVEVPWGFSKVHMVPAGPAA